MIRVFDFPETTPQQIQWIEGQMTGTNFAQIVTELDAFRENPTSEEVTVRLSDSDQRVFLESGFAGLDESVFRDCLACPASFLPLQTLALSEGGNHWTTVANSFSDTAEAPAFHAASVTPTTNAKSKTGWVGNVSWAAVASIATAAAILWMTSSPSINAPDPNSLDPNALDPNSLDPNALDPNGESIAKVAPIEFSENTRAEKQGGWGFAKFAASLDSAAPELQPPPDRSSYLRELAIAAESWSKKPTPDRQALANRLLEFRSGCSDLILADHDPLPESDREWLKSKCQSWATAIDRHLAATEAGHDIQDVQQEVQSTVTKIAAALRGRADTAIRKGDNV